MNFKVCCSWMEGFGPLAIGGGSVRRQVLVSVKTPKDLQEAEEKWISYS